MQRARMRRSHGGRSVLLAGLAAGAFLWAPVACFADVGIVVPAYFYPGTGGAGGSGNGWAQMTSAASQVPIIAVFNPDSGPLPGPADPNYTSALTNFDSAGGRTVAYVYTDYGTVPLATVEGQIETYLSQYGSLINGFYLDGMSNLPANLAYYQSLDTYIKGLSSSYTVIGNPGTITSSSYFGTAIILNTFENSSTVFNSFSAPADYATSPSLFDYTIYGAPSASAMMTDVNKAVNSDYASYVYVTDQTLPNPYDQLPSYWDQEVSAIATVRTPEPDCQAMALLTTAGIAFAVGRRRRRPVR